MLVALGAAALVTPAMAQPAPRHVQVAEVTGVINPLTADYVTRTVAQAERTGAAALVIRMDTPGGLDSAMRTIVQTILGSRVPVLVYVGPAGARAASAGLFIAMSAHVVGMAPGTNIGAAHPVSLGGGSDSVSADKATSDAAAYIRSLAETRSRNAEWAEQAVRESVSASAEEAIGLRIADLIAADLAELLARADGRRVTTASGELTLTTAGAVLDHVPMNIAERFLQVITEPTIALALISIGTVGILAEFYHPGTWYPGIAGVISLVLAWMALGSLPTNWAGVILLAIAFFLLIGEIQSPGVGAFAVGAIVAFVLGSLILFRPFGPVSPAAPAVGLNPVGVFGTALLMGLFVFVVLRALAQSRHGPILAGQETLIGASGVAVGPLDPTGVVRVADEEWSARATESVGSGWPVRVIGVRGVILDVEPTSETPVLPSAPSERRSGDA